MDNNKNRGLDMRVIDDRRNLPKTSLMVLASIGWVIMVYLVWVILNDSFERSMFSIAVLQGKVPPEINPFIDRYTAHPWQTLAHTTTGLLFATLGPLQFIPAIRQKLPVAHRISGRIFIVIGLISGIAAFLMSFSFPMWGNAINLYISVAASLLMIFAFVNAYRLARARRFVQHREWMIRGFALGMSVAVFRVFLEDVLPPMGLTFTEAWNVVTAGSFPATLIAAELWIRATRVRRSAASVSSPGVQPQA